MTPILNAAEETLDDAIIETNAIRRPTRTSKSANLRVHLRASAGIGGYASAGFR
jgi:hypothetical protein